ncbi:hypothetical protein E4T48_00706 [Aureobasidium sp. EXF-10727]|nr:hypothetical protein E4T48_00706 [Aureobasidium sp. EXF-10727]
MLKTSELRMLYASNAIKNSTFPTPETKIVDTTMKSQADESNKGELEIDSDSGVWEDWNEQVYGNIDMYLAEEYPEGFLWTCCLRTPDLEGCRSGLHKADETYRHETKKKTVYE